MGDEGSYSGPRVAATFFFRPNAQALLEMLPVPEVLSRGATLRTETFGDWNRRVSGRYHHGGGAGRGRHTKRRAVSTDEQRKQELDCEQPALRTALCAGK